MKRKIVAAAVLCACLGMAHLNQQIVIAEEKETVSVIYDGVSIGPVEIGGMTKEEAKKAVNDYVAQISNTNITLCLEGVANAEKQLVVTAADLGLKWGNPDVVEAAMELGDAGNVVRRYKARKDIENNAIVFELEFAVDENILKSVLETNIGILNIEAKDATIKKEGNRFSYTDEVDGKTVDMEKAIPATVEFLTGEWDYGETTIALATTVSKARITRALCETIEKEPIGSYTTSFTSSSSNRCGNIENAVKLMTGSVILPGETFSCLDHMVPFTAENGYYLAGSYLNGKSVDSYGGGVCQVSTTLYNAVLLAELEVVQRNNHGLTVAYVPLSADAAIAESSGMDFKFKNNTNAPIYLEGIVQNKHLTFNLYGHDERPANRTIKYESRVVEVLSPGADVVTVDESRPVGTWIVTQSSHTGYRAELYKEVYINGEKQSSERINSSYYAPAPNYVIAGPSEPESEEQEMNPDGTPVETMPAVDENGNPIEIPAPPEGTGETTASSETAETPSPVETTSASVETPASGVQETPGIQEAPGVQQETPGIQEAPGVQQETSGIQEAPGIQETPEAPVSDIIVPVG